MHPLLLRQISKRMHKKLNFSIRKIAKLLNISKSSIHRWINNSTKKKNYYNNSQFENCKQLLLDFIKNNPHIRLKDIQYYLHTKHINLSISSICRYLKLLRISYKKVSFQHYTNWNALQQKREQFNNLIKIIDKKDIISLDESYFYQQLHRSYGYSIVGKKCIVPKNAIIRNIVY